MDGKNSLVEFIVEVGRVPIIPLLGFPGRQITNSSIKQNVFNSGVHFLSLLELVDRFQPDAIFPMMDLTLEANALGASVRYHLMAPPSVDDFLITSEEDMEKVYPVDILRDGRINVFLDTMRLMSAHFTIPAAGYVIGPYTLASQLMGASQAAKAVIKKQDFLEKVLAFSTHVIGLYARALVEAGASMICVLEPSSMMLSPRQFERFSGQYLSELFTSFDANPILHICGDTTHLIEKMVATGAEGLSLDSMVDFSAIIRQLPEDVVLIGNINPVEIMLLAKPEEVHARTRQLMDQMNGFPNFILSTGCDLPEDTPFDNLDAFMSAGSGLPLGTRPPAEKVLTAEKVAITDLFKSEWQRSD
ncbi:MAG: uroporphyrinogen decarboxylase family protein [Anaerolineales bacterium]|nr:uroporphyrinogen decarboxylase family protein [Anaerolineales bacterium]